MRTGRKRALVNILLYGVFGVYLLLLLAILFRQHHVHRSLNLIPLRGILAFLTGTDLVTGSQAHAAFIKGLAFSNLLGNVIIFVPLGVYAVLFNKNKGIGRNTLLVALVSLLVEMVQVTFKMGVGDIDDVLLNTLGGLLGVLLCRGLYWLCKGDGFKVRGAVAFLAPLVGILSFAILLIINYT